MSTDSYKAISEAMPAGWRYYGDGGTMSNSSNIDIRIENGRVTEVWFRCQQLAAEVYSGATVEYTVPGEVVAGVVVPK